VSGSGEECVGALDVERRMGELAQECRSGRRSVEERKGEARRE